MGLSFNGRTGTLHVSDGSSILPCSTGIIGAFMRSEAEASVALDGETQSFPEPNVMVFRRMPDGKMHAYYEHHPDSHHDAGG